MTEPTDIQTALHARVIALAGTFQALTLVQQLARDGNVDTRPFSVCVDSVLRLDAPDPIAVFGTLSELRLGLQGLRMQIDAETEPDVEIARYWLSVLSLERKLSKQPRMLEEIATEVGSWRMDIGTPHAPGEAVVEALGSLYRRTLSTLTPRIMVRGEPAYLNAPNTAAGIRALLLAAIRSAVLWRQMGGSRLSWLFARSQISTAAGELLQSIDETIAADS